MKKTISMVVLIVMLASVLGTFLTNVSADTPTGLKDFLLSIDDVIPSAESTTQPTTPPPATEPDITRGHISYQYALDIVRPNKAFYIEGEILDLSGLEVYLTYGEYNHHELMKEFSRYKLDESEMDISVSDSWYSYDATYAKSIDEPLTINDRRVRILLLIDVDGTPSYGIWADFKINVTSPSQPGIEINGIPVFFPDQQPIIVNNMTLAPIRGVFEQMGFRIDWNPNMRQVILKNSGYTLVVTESATSFTVNGKSYDLDVPARIINGRMMIPIRAVFESVGYIVDWDGDRNAVVVVF